MDSTPILVFPQKRTRGLGTKVATSRPRATALTTVPQTQGQTAGGLQGTKSSSLQLTSFFFFFFSFNLSLF